MGVVDTIEDQHHHQPPQQYLVYELSLSYQSTMRPYSSSPLLLVCCYCAIQIAGYVLVVVAAGGAPDERMECGPLHVFLLMGQSNMVGRYTTEACRWLLLLVLLVLMLMCLFVRRVAFDPFHSCHLVLLFSFSGFGNLCRSIGTHTRSVHNNNTKRYCYCGFRTGIHVSFTRSLDGSRNQGYLCSLVG